MSSLAPTLQAFFAVRLAQQQASPNTVGAYRDALRLLIVFAAKQTGSEPCQLDITQLDAPLIGAFLDHLEHERHNSARTRNARLAAIHSLFRYAALRHPEHAAVIQRVLAIPPKRADRNLISYLDEPEIAALLATPDRSTWSGRRDHALLTLTVQTGVRVSELTGLNNGDIHLVPPAHLNCHGKGRKERITPLTKATVATIRVWQAERNGLADEPLFPTRQGARLSRDAIERRLAKLPRLRGTDPDRRAGAAGAAHRRACLCDLRRGGASLRARERPAPGGGMNARGKSDIRQCREEESVTSVRHTDRRPIVKLTDVAEFTGELARDAELVERRIVRLTQEARAAQGGAFHYLLVHSGAVIEGQLVCLTAYVGQHWGEGMAETRAAYERADELAKRIRTACEAAGLETRPGAFEEQLR